MTCLFVGKSVDRRMLMTEQNSGEGMMAHTKLREVVGFSLWKGKKQGQVSEIKN